MINNFPPSGSPLIPNEQSQFSSPTRKIDSAVYSCFASSKSLDETTGLNQFFYVRGSFDTVHHC